VSVLPVVGAIEDDEYKHGNLKIFTLGASNAERLDINVKFIRQIIGRTRSLKSQM